ncbi:transposase [Shewanella sp. GutCb]|jgi:transposase|uniref:transposase n=1 Tax=Shewanella sp. GutCb TaxID=2058315 RepID=UPI000C7DF939|nr:transposase [Shewanella sp. GutCb]PKG74486.1 transposase [Shewanella sp. GutCb]
MTAVNHTINLSIINEVKSNGRLLSDVAKQYGVSTKAVYQLVRQSEQPSTSRTLTLRSEIEQLRSRIQELTLELSHITQ